MNQHTPISDYSLKELTETLGDIVYSLLRSCQDSLETFSYILSERMKLTCAESEHTQEWLDSFRSLYQLWSQLDNAMSVAKNLEDCIASAMKLESKNSENND